MHAAVTTPDAGPLVLEDRPDPIPAADELLVAVSRCGICGSDLHSGHLAPPGQVLGHEIAGEVVEVGGEAAATWRPGQRVAVFPVKGCGRCAACLTGRVAHCASVEMIGFTRAGGFADLVSVGAREAVALPDLLDDAEGALVEPLAVGLHALHAGSVEPGEPVLITGGGPVGLAVLVWARRLGVGPIIVSEPSAARRAVAEGLGATATVDPLEADVASVVARVAGSPPSVVVECSGKVGLLDQAMGVAAPHGRLVVAGMCSAPDTVHHVLPMMKELTVRYVIYYEHRDFDSAIRLLLEDGFDGTALVSDTIGLTELPSRFEELKQPTADTKVQVDPRR